MVRAGEWSGTYAGIIVGGGLFDTDYRHLDLNHPNFSIETSGALGGGIVGYNWRVGNAVLGVEADLAGASMDGQWAGHPDHVSEVNWIATLRGRAGVLATPKLLIFATAGAAWLDQTFTHIGHHQWDQTFTGWTVGAGLDYEVWTNVRLGLDALYMDFGSKRDTHPHDGTTHTIEAEPSGFVARARLTIKIGG